MTAYQKLACVTLEKKDIELWEEYYNNELKTKNETMIIT